ncbi:MAG: hypothetical protein IKW89_02445 [Bacteroidales bacterium]|nr:hypothetical protein [Bacteroidales bacterium]
MAHLNQILVSTFESIYETKTPCHRPLLEVLEEMRNPGDDLKDRIKLIRKAKAPAEQDQMKMVLLPVVCPSGTFSERNDAALLQYSGVVCLDLDDVISPRDIKALAKTIPYTLAVMTSPTGSGVKVFILTDSTDPSRHSDLYHHLGVVTGFKKRLDLKFDPSCSNPSRACFFSYDRDLWINKDVVPFHVDFATVPVYTPPAKVASTVPSATKSRTELDYDNPVFPAPLTDQNAIRDAIIDTHSLFEDYHAVFLGVRNNNLYILAFFFRLEGIPEDVATDYLVAYYVDPAGGFSADEIKRTVHSAYIR